MKPRVYLETTIPSYLVARPSRDLVVAAHQELTHEWWHTRRPEFTCFVSQFVIDEAALGNADMSRRRLEAISDMDQLEITPDVLSLAEQIVSSGAIPQKAAVDAAHVAVATVNAMDFLLTWNCAHIANAEIYRKIQHTCNGSGFECPVICTPQELMGEDTDDR
jgi:hypothetical protein